MAPCYTLENTKRHAIRPASLLCPCRKMLSDVLLSNGQSITLLENPWTNFIATNKHDQEMLIRLSVTVLLLPPLTLSSTSSTQDLVQKHPRREKTVVPPPLTSMHTGDLARLLCDSFPQALQQRHDLRVRIYIMSGYVSNKKSISLIFTKIIPTHISR